MKKVQHEQNMKSESNSKSQKIAIRKNYNMGRVQHEKLQDEQSIVTE